MFKLVNYCRRGIIIKGIINRSYFISNEGKATEKGKYFILITYGVFLVLFGLFLDSPLNIVKGIVKIILDPDFLITDYIGIGGIGAAFVNSGLVTLITILILYRMKIHITGASISTIWLMSGFSLFGKNIFNIWFIIIGVYLYSIYQKDKFSKYIYMALLGTSLAPMTTQIMLGTDLPIVLRIIVGTLSGVLVGFVLPPLASYLMRVHQGFNLYNTGFAAGLAGTIFVSLFKSYGLEVEQRLIWTSGNNRILGLFLIFIFTSMILWGFTLSKEAVHKIKSIMKYGGRLVTDFVILEGFPAALINMGINGLFAAFYVIIIGGDLNGPTIGGIFTIAGFGAFGKHLKNMIPIILGIFVGSITKIWSINDPAIQLAALFGTTLAPIAGEFGWKYGIAAGFIHSSVVLNVTYLHAGFNLYNNGFAGGIVAAVLVPIIEAFRKE